MEIKVKEIRYSGFVVFPAGYDLYNNFKSAKGVYIQSPCMSLCVCEEFPSIDANKCALRDFLWAIENTCLCVRNLFLLSRKRDLPQPLLAVFRIEIWTLRPHCTTCTGSILISGFYNQWILTLLVHSGPHQHILLHSKMG